MNWDLISHMQDWRSALGISKKRKKKRTFQPEVEHLETRWVLSSDVDFSSATYSVGESAGSKTITVNIDQAVTQTSSIDYATSDGTATAGSDYTTASGTLTWEPEDGLSKTFNVSITSDSTDENDETVSLALSNPTGDIVLGTTTSATMTITDDDAPPTVDFGASAGTVGEGDGTATFTVVLSAASGKTVSVSIVDTLSGSALPGDDYSDVDSSVTFNPGETSTTFDVTIIDDTEVESTEDVNLELDNPTNATLNGQPTDAVQITDDDPEFHFSAAAYSVDEDAGTATITITVDVEMPEGYSVNYATSDGTATAGEDYTSTSGTMSWDEMGMDPPSLSFTIPISTDTRKEEPETVIITLSSPSTGSLETPYVAVLTIKDVAPSTWTVDGPWEPNPDSDLSVHGVSLQDGNYQTVHACGTAPGGG